jgi:hypothetical protein
MPVISPIYQRFTKEDAICKMVIYADDNILIIDDGENKFVQKNNSPNELFRKLVQ